jgi:hypothetical protein
MESVVEVKVTVSPDVAEAVRFTGVVEYTTSAGLVNAIVCVAAATLKLLVTEGAAVQFASPGWSAAIEQVPTVTSVTEVPVTVQMAGVVELKLTVRPEVAVAPMVTGDALTATPFG